MSVEKLREDFAEELYSELSNPNRSFSKEDVQMLQAVESARIAERDEKTKREKTIAELSANEASLELKKQELELKAEELKQSAKEFELRERELDLKEKDFELRDAMALTENANREIERKSANRMKAIEIAVTATVTVAQAAFWAWWLGSELNQTRKFELDATETSAAFRIIRNCVPKIKF